jgi:putative transposase
MSRAPRRCAGGIVYHVLNRANGRLGIFKTPGDYEAFERVLGESLRRVPVRLCGYCVMPNHWHLVLWPCQDGELSEFMQWLTLTHTQRWHAAHGTTGIGHIYQGRFKGFPIQSDNHYLTALAYVESNPLRGSLIDDACKWRYSSLAIRTGRATPDLTLSYGPVKLPDNWPQLANRLPGKAIVERLDMSIRRSSPYGSETWVRNAARTLGLEATLRPMGRPRKPE